MERMEERKENKENLVKKMEKGKYYLLIYNNNK